MKVLVTGGLGYIGSHCCVAMKEAGWTPVIIDNLSRSRPAVLDRLARITGVRPDFIQGDLRDRKLLETVFTSHDIHAVMHCAGFKAVGESVAQPLTYFDNNVGASLTLLSAMKDADVKTFIFSSSATVYGASSEQPVREDSVRCAVNPYGHSKVMVENILESLACAEPDWRIISLRYFNPAGAHESGLIGEDAVGIPNNLAAYITQVAVGRRPCLYVFGNDYTTRDGTGLRDYIHVMDLAEGHIAALEYLKKASGCQALNLGTGRNVSVFEVLEAFKRATGQDIPFEIRDRRPGDVAACWADPSRAEQTLGWRASRTLDTMCEDAWRWQAMNPFGYVNQNDGDT